MSDWVMICEERQDRDIGVDIKYSIEQPVQELKFELTCPPLVPRTKNCEPTLRQFTPLFYRHFLIDFIDTNFFKYVLLLKFIFCISG